MIFVAGSILLLLATLLVFIAFAARGHIRPPQVRPRYPRGAFAASTPPLQPADDQLLPQRAIRSARHEPASP